MVIKCDNTMKDANLAPIILFLYNRLDHTKRTVEALQRNDLAGESDLYVFCDGPKNDSTQEQIKKVLEVQDYADTIEGFKHVFVQKQQVNKGLANSVISGVSEVIEKYGKVVVVEDDILTHPFFLRYMNDCLDTYQDRKDIYMIGGYNYNIKIPHSYRDDVYVVYRSCSWGWATWKECWDLADWEVSDYQLMCNNMSLQSKFNRGGGDMFPMLKAQMEGKIDSWAIRWDYSMYKHDALCLHPIMSMCDNCGLDGSGVHCSNMPDNFTAKMYNKNSYRIRLNMSVKLNNIIARHFSYFQETGGKQIPTFFTKVRNKISYISSKVLRCMLFF